MLPEVTVTAEVADRRLAALPWHVRLRMATQVVWHKDKWQSPALCAFLRVSREVLDAPAHWLRGNQG